MTVERVIQNAPDTTGLGQCPWCQGHQRTLPLGMCRTHAAAPDLLAACHSLVQVIEQLIPEPSARGVADVVLFQARAAIAKAEGK